jgi:thiamine biosynthesis protein ThiI
MVNAEANSEPLPHVLLLRFSGELSTKARVTRAQFTKRLLRNLRDALASEQVRARVVQRHDRILVESEDAAVENLLSRVFGLQSLSRVERRPGAHLEELVGAGVELFRHRVVGRRFAVRARRVGERRAVPFASKQVEEALGAALRPFAEGVDLEHPEVTVHVEVYEGQAYFFTERVPGPGGLPLGASGRALALVSGGYDSAVAAWQMQKRGVMLDHLFCNLGGASHRLGVMRVMKVVADRWSYGARPHLHSVDFEPLAAQIRERIERRYWQVILKRLMLRAADALAQERGAVALVTGEAVGQVSSQTLQNLAVISEVTRLPVLRPLVGFNKDEIIALAERIGTAPLSAVVQEYCAMVPHRPATAAAPDAVAEEESKLDVDLLEGVLAQREVFDLRAVDPEAHGLPAIDVEKIPSGAVVIDLRSRQAFRAWHYDEAVHLDFARALRAYASFDRDRTYVLYCEFGLKSAYLAEQMRAAGFEAFHVKGGTKRLLRDAGTLDLGPVRLDD